MPQRVLSSAKKLLILERNRPTEDTIEACVYLKVW
jgi:hypothetical protein